MNGGCLFMGLGVDIFPQISSNGNSGAFFCLFEFFSSGKTGFGKLGALASVICGYEFGMD